MILCWVIWMPSKFVLYTQSDDVASQNVVHYPFVYKI